MRQNKVLSYIFRLEFVAIYIKIEIIEALQYKLRHFGIPKTDRLMCFVLTSQ